LLVEAADFPPFLVVPALLRVVDPARLVADRPLALDRAAALVAAVPVRDVVDLLLAARVRGPVDCLGELLVPGRLAALSADARALPALVIGSSAMGSPMGAVAKTTAGRLP
jgi:hypothetical protein